MDIFNAGVVHTARTTCQRIKRRFKNLTEDSGRDSRPIEAAACLFEEQIFNFRREVRDFDCAGEQAAIEEREFFLCIVEIRVALGKRGIEHDKKVQQPASDVIFLLQIVAKDFMFAENARGFGEKTKNKSHAKFIEAGQRIFVVGIEILGVKSVIQFADDFTCFKGKFKFDAQFIFGVVDKKIECVKLFGEFGEQNFSRFGERFHIIQKKFGKVANDNPTRTH